MGLRRLCLLDQQVLYALHTHRIRCHLYINLTRINFTSTAAGQHPMAANAHQRNSANHSRTSRSARPWSSTTTATAPARLYHRASTQIQAFHQTHQPAVQPTRPTAKRIHPPHQAQAVPGAMATTSPEKSHKKNNSTRSALCHNRTHNETLRASTNLHQPLLRHLAQQVSQRLSPSAKSTATTPQRQPRLRSWRRSHAITFSRRRWGLRGRGSRRRIRLTCLLRR